MISQKRFLHIQKFKGWTGYNTGRWWMSGKGVTVEFSFQENKSFTCEVAKSRMIKFESLIKNKIQ